jgi:hypothetical protein
MKFYHFSPVQGLKELKPNQPADSDLAGVYLCLNLEDSWYWLSRMLNEGYNFADVCLYEVHLDPSDVLHPRYERDKVIWLSWNGAIIIETDSNGFNNYQQFVVPHKVECRQIL